MRILALETTDRSGRVAALLADQLICERLLPDGERSAQSLAGGIRDLLAQVGWKAHDVELIAVATGPGSFTGLRVGVTTAKTLAYATGTQVFGVDTLEAIASQFAAHLGRLHVVLDAQRRQFFAATYLRSVVDACPPTPAVAIVDRQAWLDNLQVGDAVTGPALAQIEAQLPAGVVRVERSLWHPTATAVGQVAWRHYQAGERHDLWSLVPQYHRLSAAEEKLK